MISSAGLKLLAQIPQAFSPLVNKEILHSLEIEQIAGAFCSNKFAETYLYMADKIKWNIVGEEELVDREAAIRGCCASAKFLETVSLTITKPKIIRTEIFVVVEGAARFQSQEEPSLKPWPVVTFLNLQGGNLLRLLPMSLS